MHGEIFDLDTPMGTHPNCRCTMLPYLGGKLNVTLGKDQFEKLSEKEQRRILGKEAFKEYKAGKVELSDFVKKNKSDEWGVTRSRRSLRDILAEKEDSQSNELKKGVSKLIEKAKGEEPKITLDLFQASKNSKTSLRGTEDRFKSRESLLRKAESFSKNGTVHKTKKYLNDTLRYTFSLSDENYSNEFESIVSDLTAKGYKKGRMYNAWSKAGTDADTGYRGINLTLRSPNGFDFEVQFHTEQSWKFKTDSHILYEERRDPNTSEQRVKEIENLMINVAKAINIPTGAKELR